MTKNLLAQIHSPADLRKIPQKDLPRVATALREFIINIVSANEGHLGASLGTIELTIALHYFFNTPTDKLIWDVGHQAYGHKILTGRKDQFYTNRKLHGISGFPKRTESIYDTFGGGHSSTSISAALGMAIADRLITATSATSSPKEHIAIIGDAGLASGMAFEALNHAGATQTNLWVILNDNGMGIDPCVGALTAYLSRLKEKESTESPNFFEDLNFHYYGPIDGHDFNQLFRAFEGLKSVNGPKLLHVVTTKGKGLPSAERDQVRFHAPGKFDKQTGAPLSTQNQRKTSKFQDVFGQTLLELAEKDQKIVGVTAAMPSGTSLKLAMQKFPDRFFDVGIAEQHAVTFSAGMATAGKTVFCALYSTFLQRGYDQLIHDVALQDLPVIFCIDRAGLVGADGPSHHGVFDIAYLRCIPNIMIAAPSDEIELRNLLYTASLGLNHPIAIRYPRGYGRLEDWKKPFKKTKLGKGIPLKEGRKIAVLSVGPLKNAVTMAIETTQDPKAIGHYDMRFIKPLDTALLDRIFRHYQTVVTVEDGTLIGGFGDAVLDYANTKGFSGKVVKLGIPDRFIEQGTIAELQDLVDLSAQKIAQVLKDELRDLGV